MTTSDRVLEFLGTVDFSKLDHYPHTDRPIPGTDAVDHVGTIPGTKITFETTPSNDTFSFDLSNEPGYEGIRKVTVSWSPYMMPERSPKDARLYIIANVTPHEYPAHVELWGKEDGRNHYTIIADRYSIPGQHNYASEELPVVAERFDGSGIGFTFFPDSHPYIVGGPQSTNGNTKFHVVDTPPGLISFPPPADPLKAPAEDLQLNSGISVSLANLSELPMPMRTNLGLVTPGAEITLKR